MSIALVSLTGFVAWNLALVAAIAIARVRQVLSGEKRANEFPSGIEHGGDMYWRLNRAHLNTAENLPIFAALILMATLLGMKSTAIDVLAMIVLAARVVQSVVHISSGSSRAVSVRFTAFITQLACYLILVILILAGPHEKIVHQPKWFG